MLLASTDLEMRDKRWYGHTSFLEDCDKELKVYETTRKVKSRRCSVLNAGEIVFSKGRVEYWTNNSGHYTPPFMPIEGLPNSGLDYLDL